MGDSKKVKEKAGDRIVALKVRVRLSQFNHIGFFGCQNGKLPKSQSGIG